MELNYVGFMDPSITRFYRSLVTLKNILWRKKKALFDIEKEIQLQHIKDLGNCNSADRADTNVKHLIVAN